MSGSRPSGRSASWWALAVLSVLALLFFFWRLRGDLTALPYRPGSDVSDLTVTFWPNVHYIQETWRAHRQIPLWRTLIFCGSPFDADPQSGLWYPPNLVFALLPATVGFNVLFVLHTVLAGLGMWTWSRATATSTGGALLAALVYAFTPRIMVHLGFGHVGLVYAAAWVPWALEAAYGLARGSGSRVSRWRHAATLGVALGLQLMAHPQLAFYTGAAAGVYGLTTALAWPAPSSLESYRSRLASCVLRVIPLVVGALVALGVAAVQWLPLLQLAPLTARSSMGLVETVSSSLPPRYLWGLILADHRGYMDYVLYVGLPVLALVVLALRRRQARFWWAFVGLALVYALGANTPIYGWAFGPLSGLGWLRAPSRIWFVAAAALALMAGWGIDRMVAGLGARGRRWVNRAALALGTLPAALLVGYAIAIGKPPGNLIGLGLVAPATAGLCAATAARKLPRRAALLAWTVLLLADLWIVDATLVEGLSEQDAFAESGLAAYLAGQKEGEPFRVYSPSYSLPRHIAARYGLETADGVDPLYLEDYAAWLSVATGVERTGYTETVPSLEGGGDIATANREATPDTRLLGLLNVRYVAAEFPMSVEGLREVRRFGSAVVYENEHALPRAFVVGQVEPVDDFDAALGWVQGHDVARAATVEDGPPLAA
ncbi:MAG: hypothetical protein U9R72_04725, partial [Chloroflexota bacterium]|nr:hypothetical protein [Chloroflexota bacterium]